MNAPLLNRHPSHAFSLVEVTIALGIAVFCLVVIFGLLSVGVNMSSVSIEQTSATNLLAAVVSDLRTAPIIPYKEGNKETETLVYHVQIPFNRPAVGGSSPDVRPDAAALSVINPFTMKTEDNALIDDYGRRVEKVSQARYRLTGWMRPGNGRDATIASLRLTWPPATTTNPAGSVETLVALDRN